MILVLSLRGISRRFGAVRALREVDFQLGQGEIHALLGENGAGKSTMMKIAFGLLRPDAGAIEIAGQPVRVRDPSHARQLGIGMVHQHFTSIPAFTVAETVALAAGWRAHPRVAIARVEALGAKTGLVLDPTLRVSELSAGLKQRLEVLKALAGECRVLLLDEPTSVLSPPEAETLLDLVRGLRTRGVSTVLITHKLVEALAVADRITVLRRGAVVWSGAAGGTTALALAGHMLGEAAPRAALPRASSSGPPGEVRVQAESLAVARLAGSGSGLRHATFNVHAGEVVGIAAVEGNGQRELLRTIAGLARPSGGSLEFASPVSFIPEDRTSESLIGEFSLTENLVLSQGNAAPWIRGPWVDWRAARARAGELIGAFDVRAAGPEAAARSLSGGNQQRMVVASALERRPAILLAENPTRGLDVRASEEVMARLAAAAARGVAVMVHLADLDELLQVADRILVLANGVVWEAPPGTSREEIGRRMLGAAVEGGGV